MYTTISFKAGTTNFKIELRKRITLIQGGIGKSMFFKSLQIVDTDYPLLTIDGKQAKKGDTLKHLKSITNTMVVIDNGDLLLNKAIVQHINKDLKNQYIVICKQDYGFAVSPNAIADMTFSSDTSTFWLRYRFDVRGW